MPSSRLLISSSLLVLIFLVTLASASHHSHHSHHHSHHKKMRLCGKRLATTISAMCTESSIDECPENGSGFEGSIIMKCCAGQCSIQDIRSYCCSIKETEKQMEEQSNYLNFLEEDSEESHPKKIHHSQKDRYDVLNF